MLLTRITWALVIIGFGLLMGGFFASDANVLLILAIAVELAAIILVLASWARRAKDAADAYDEDLSFAGSGAGSGTSSRSSVSDDTADHDDLESTFADEEFSIGARASSRRTTRKPAARSKPKPKAGARSASAPRKPAAKRKPASKAKPAKAKAKPAARKPAAKAKAKPKPKPAARKPAKRKPTRRKP